MSQQDQCLLMVRKGWFNTMHIKFNDKNSTAQNLKKAEAIFKKYNPEYPFEYNFVDEEYAKKFEDEKRTGNLPALFAALQFLFPVLVCLVLQLIWLRTV